MKLHLHSATLERLASAYALGTLRGGARRRFETLAQQHPTIQAAAQRWQQRLTGLAELQPDHPLPAHLWARIQAQLAAERAWAQQHRQPLTRPGWRSRWSGWRLSRWAGAMASVVGGLSWGLWSHQEAAQLTERLAQLQRQHIELAQQLGQAQATQALLRQDAQSAVSQLIEARAQQAEERDRLEGELRSVAAAARVSYVAVLSDEQASAGLLATYDERQQRLTLRRLGQYREAANRSLQLWSIGPSGKPQSLGVLRRGGPETWAAAAPALASGRLLAISLEPLGGVPEAGGPTGPVLFKGSVLKVG